MGKSEPPAPPGITTATLASALMRRISHIEDQVERLGEDLDRVGENLNKAKEFLMLIVPEAKAATEEIVEEDKIPVAHNLTIRRNPNGYILFVIDGGKPVRLRPRLAEVFEFLATGDKDPSGRDALVGWRSRTDIIAYLEKRATKPIRRAYVNHMVHLIRKALHDAKYDDRLIQTHDVKGVRLAYKSRRQGEPPSGKGKLSKPE